jgi:DNA-directed RNA polymerase I, II, and III subunit RPABC2
MQKYDNDSENEKTPKSDPENENDSDNEESGFKDALKAKEVEGSDSDSATITDIDDSDIEEGEGVGVGDDEDEDEGAEAEAEAPKPSFVSGLSKLMKRVGTAVENIGSDVGSAAAEQGDVAKPSTRKPRTSRKKTSSFVQPTQEELDDMVGEEDDEEGEFGEDDDEESKLKKFDKEMRDEYLMNFHPESLIENYDEIYNLARVVRDSNGVIVDNLHKTLPIMTKYEKTRILGQRAKQINDGAVPFIKVPEGVIDGYLIALRELEEKKIPFIIRRPLPNRGSEYWYVEDLELLI